MEELTPIPFTSPKPTAQAYLLLLILCPTFLITGLLVGKYLFSSNTPTPLSGVTGPLSGPTTPSPNILTLLNSLTAWNQPDTDYTPRLRCANGTTSKGTLTILRSVVQTIIANNQISAPVYTQTTQLLETNGWSKCTNPLDHINNPTANETYTKNGKLLKIELIPNSTNSDLNVYIEN